ncbi:MAG: FKBP-type peptidyl-prolyl cis-trans isomerase [Ginsengibacter sp.]
MSKSIFLAAATIIFLAAGCTERNFVKAKNGLEYKIVDGDGGKEIKYGNTIKFRAMSYYGDSLMSTPFDSVPQLMEVDSTKLPPEYVAIFKAAKKGDSIVTRILVDSIMKFNQVPPFAKKGQYLGYRFKILDVITDPAQAAAMKQEMMEELKRMDSVSAIKQQSIDDKTLSDYLSKNNIKATKTEKGTYVEIQDPGTGEQVAVGKAITVDYKGMTMEGKVFDQSYDSSGKSIKPYTFLVGERGAIEGWPDGLVYFKKGGRGRLFIPSRLAYGARGAGPDIPANTPIMFDVSVIDVMPAEAYQKKMQEQQQMMQQLQQMQQQQQKQQPNAQGK